MTMYKISVIATIRMHVHLTLDSNSRNCGSIYQVSWKPQLKHDESILLSNRNFITYLHYMGIFSAELTKSNYACMRVYIECPRSSMGYKFL